MVTVSNINKKKEERRQKKEESRKNGHCFEHKLVETAF